MTPFRVRAQFPASTVAGHAHGVGQGQCAGGVQRAVGHAQLATAQGCRSVQRQGAGVQLQAALPGVVAAQAEGSGCSLTRLYVGLHLFLSRSFFRSTPFTTERISIVLLVEIQFRMLFSP